MTGLSFCIAAALLGMDFGWQPLPGGGMEYIIQLDPLSLAELQAGRPIQSDIPPAAGDVRSYRIIVGTGKPPRKTPSLPPPSLLPGPAARHIDGRPAVFIDSEERAEPKKAAGERPGGQTAQPRREGGSKATASPEPAKPLLALTLTCFGLFASLGSNVYLAWIAVGLWRRCRSLVAAQVGV